MDAKVTRKRIWHCASMRPGRPDRAPGFTLVECLVALALVALLAGLVLPVLFTAREASRQSRCLSNMRQIGGAMRMYAQDWDDRYPMNRFGVRAPGSPARYTWKSALTAYIKNIGVFRCPSNQFYSEPVEAREIAGRSYALNAAAGELGPPAAAIREPAEIIELSEARYQFPDVYPSETYWSSFRYSSGNLPDPSAALGAMQTHNGNCNFVFYDGHAAGVKVLTTLERHRPLTMWHYSLLEPRNYGSQANFNAMRVEWRNQLLAHAEYRR